MAHWIESGETYGCPRIHAALLAEAHRVSRKRVARLMRELGIKGVTRRRYETDSKRPFGYSANEWVVGLSIPTVSANPPQTLLTFLSHPQRFCGADS